MKMLTDNAWQYNTEDFKVANGMIEAGDSLVEYMAEGGKYVYKTSAELDTEVDDNEEWMMQL